MPLAHSPYVIGQWVRGDRFYGRDAVLDSLIASTGWSWIAGLRRIGKTSLLRELEYRIEATLHGLPLVVDLQGVDGGEELALALVDALLDAERACERAGVDPEACDDPDPLAVLAHLERQLARSPTGPATQVTLLLDEADELPSLDAATPGLVPRLWRSLEAWRTRVARLHVVMASSLRLVDREDDDVWRERFETPRYLGTLEPAAARALVRQDQRPPAHRPRLDENAVDILCRGCGHHPMLVQMAAKRLVAGPTTDASAIRRIVGDVASEASVDRLLQVDWSLLTDDERQVLNDLGRGRTIDALAPATARLHALGLVGHDHGQLRVASDVLASWLVSR